MKIEMTAEEVKRVLKAHWTKKIGPGERVVTVLLSQEPLGSAEIEIDLRADLKAYP